MCGLCGFMDEGEDVPLSEGLDMLSKIRHRGPDQVGVYLDGEVSSAEKISGLKLERSSGSICLAQSRLEIVGGREGVQPITGEKLTLVHNGEIYNHRELRKLLVDDFGLGSDSDVVLRVLEEYYDGDLLHAVKQAMPVLDGMYALAVTDGDSLVLARDPIGKKPLYYTDGLPFYFASERKALLHARSNDEIKRVLPGKLVLVTGDGVSVHDGYEVERPPIEINEMEEAICAYEEVFDHAVDKRVRGLDRVGVLFSGGIDSVLVARALQLKGLRVTCYTVGAEGSGDVEMAIKAARELGLEINVEYLTDDLISSCLPEVIQAIELNGLLQVEVAIPMYIAARNCAKDGHKVMFSGQAADELFAGYSWYRDVVKEHGHLYLHQKLWEDIDKLYEDTLEREDRMAMAHSIELRAPFLDREVMRTAMRIAPHLKLTGGDDVYGKRVHRELSMRKGIPREFAYREKSPAQEGTGVHDMIQALASKHYKGKDVDDVELVDFGSSYRYLGNHYGTPETMAYLRELSEESAPGSIVGAGSN
ncbi:MAG: asparagine synthetase B [Candidatus Dadabacteria bacterium]|nr:asparagine synthetase B [Candidatus Dadabacteria bacterium]